MTHFSSVAVSCLLVFCVLLNLSSPSSATEGSDPSEQNYNFGKHKQSVQPHLVFLIGDDIGWNDVGWNNPTMYTPFMNSLASEGVILDHYYTFPQCTPSRSSVLTGVYANRLGLQRGVLMNEEPYGVPLSFSMLPEHLKKAGYESHAMGKWHVGYCSEEYTPTFRGFDSFLGYYNGAEENFLHCVSDTYVYTKETCDGFDFHNDTLRAPQYYGLFSAEVQTKRAVDIINNYRRGGKSLFLYISITDMHFPVQSGPKYLAKCENNVNGARTNFCGAMAALDESVQNITNALKQKNMWNNTVFVFVSDNGASATFGGNNYPLRGEKSTQWEGGSRVPAFVYSPLLKKKKYVNHHLIHVTDWYPTFLRLAGAKPVRGIDGVNQWSTISENKTSCRKDLPYLFDQGNGTLVAAIRNSKYKLMVGPGGDRDKIYTENDTVDQSFNLTFLAEYTDTGSSPFNFSDRSIKLFDLENDPSENNDIANQETRVVRRMLRRLLQYQERVKPAVKLASDPAGKPSNFDGWYMPGWCKARTHVPTYTTTSTNHLNFVAL